MFETNRISHRSAYSITKTSCCLSTFILLFLNSIILIRAVNSTADLVNTSDNAVLCYSCMATPPLYANVRTDELTDHLFEAAFDTSSNQSIRLPQINLHCRETHVTGQGQFLDTSKFICQTGACVKLKGIYQGETFVVRECWERLWERKYDGKWRGCAPVNFLADTNTEICVCSLDLCNAASFNLRTCSISTSLFLLIILSTYALTYSYSNPT